MSMNESETRFELIDPLLRGKGYRMPHVRLESPAPVEPIGRKGHRCYGPGSTDDQLCVEVANSTVPLSVAILDAKKEDEERTSGCS
jgi:hypothetical protein